MVKKMQQQVKKEVPESLMRYIPAVREEAVGTRTQIKGLHTSSVIVTVCSR
jgi:hypothetical protein